MRSARQYVHLFGWPPLILAMGTAFLLSVGAAAQDNAGLVKDLTGQAFAQTSAARRTLAPQAAIMFGDQVETRDKSLVTLLLGRRTTLRLGAHGNVVIDKFLVEAGGDITLQSGSGPLMVEHPEGQPAEPLQIHSSYGLIAVRGTRFFVGPEGQALAVFVERGEVSVKAGGTTVTVRSGEGTAIPRAGARPARVARWKAKRIDALFGSLR